MQQQKQKQMHRESPVHFVAREWNPLEPALFAPSTMAPDRPLDEEGANQFSVWIRSPCPSFRRTAAPSRHACRQVVTPAASGAVTLTWPSSLSGGLASRHPAGSRLPLPQVVTPAAPGLSRWW